MIILKIICYSVFVLLFARCTVVPIIDKWQNLSNNQWNKSNKISIPIEIADSDYYYNVYINLRVTNDYKYSNLWMKLNIKYPDSTKLKNDIMLTLADHRGKWIGHSLGHIISFRLPALKNKVFGKSGKYIFELEQNMRDTVLKEIISVGIKIDKEQEILK